MFKARLPKGVRLSYETIIFDAEQQIRDFLERNWKEIQEYKGNFCCLKKMLLNIEFLKVLIS